MGVIVLGCPTVIIGDVGGGGAGSSFSGNMSAAKESASAFTSATATADSSRSSATPSEKPSDAERTLAAQPGTSPAHRAAREKVVRDFYQDRPGLGADRANQDLKGIALDKPVRVVSFPPPDTMTQNVRAKTKRPGAFFDPVGGQSPESLGISGSGRVPVVFKTPPGEGLQSTAAPIVDNWTDSANPLFCNGGGTQLTVDSNTLAKFTALPAAGGA